MVNNKFPSILSKMEKLNVFIFLFISLFILLLFIIYITQKYYFTNKIIESFYSLSEEESANNRVIPLNIFQTWSTSNLPSNMQKCVDKLKSANPEFKYYLFNDVQCYDYIKNNYELDVLNAFDTLVPGAFKADLFRYCILYKEGGIYIDIKFYTSNGVKLINFTDKEYFVRDIDFSGKGIYNAFMICKPGNPILKKCIDQVVENVKNRYYGKSQLYTTGPLLMRHFFSQEEINKFELYLYIINDKKDVSIYYKDKPILEIYNEYRKEQKIGKNQNYHDLWVQKSIYKD